MLEQNLVTIQQYAIKHKMSTFAVLKLVNAKKLQTIKKRANDEEQEYIIDESQPSKTVVNKSEVVSEVEAEQGKSINYEVEFHKLLAKYVDLQEKYTNLIEKSK